MPAKTLWEQISKGLGEAITDIREKVVEEPMWGRTLTDHHGQEEQQMVQWPAAAQSNEIDNDHEQDLDRDL